MTGSLGQQVIVDNRPTGVMSGQIVSKAQPDGYTLVLSGSILWIMPFLQSVPFDPVKDFSPITLTVSTPNIVVVHPALPVKSVKELIALARSKPGRLNYGTSGTGTANHLAAELFKLMAGVDIVSIKYKSPGAALTDVIAGEVQMMFATAASVAPHIKSARLRSLAVTSNRPSALAPDLPTVAASGLPGYEVETINGILAPAKTPAALITRLNQEIVRALHSADVKEKLFSAGVEAVGSSPEQLAAAIKSEMDRMGRLIKDAGIRGE
jgi:tripartite-type tricarboxylate transporter receptor subunit TctC